MKTPAEIAAETLRTTHSFPIAPSGSDLRMLMARAVEADRKQLHGLGANDVEVEPHVDPSGPWVNVLLYRNEECDAEGDPVLLGSILLSTREAEELRQELNVALRAANRDWANGEVMAE